MQADKRTQPARFFFRLSGVLSVAVMMLLPSVNADAYSWRTCDGGKQIWESRRATMYISTTSMPIGSIWDTRLQNAMWHWNNVKGSGFLFYVGRDTDGTHRDGNGRNEIYFDADDTGSALAVTFSRWNCYWLFGWHTGYKEADIAFNTSVFWNLGSYVYPGTETAGISFEGVALHELGHALGLLHENRWMATMNSYYPSGGPVGYTREWDPLADDRAGARYLYPDSTVETDVAASAMKSTGSGTSGVVTVTPTGVYRGSDVNIEFTFMNQGTSAQTFNIGFYLSPDAYITTADTFLGMNYGAWAASGMIGTFTRSLTIPSYLNPGIYYIGYFVDYDGRIAEDKEYNNYQQIPKPVTVYVY